MVYYWQFYPKHLSSKFQCCISLYIRNINENLSKMSNILKLVNGKNSITGTQKGKLKTLRKYFQPCKLHIHVHSSCVYYHSYNYAEYWVDLKSLSLFFFLLLSSSILEGIGHKVLWWTKWNLEGIAPTTDNKYIWK